MLSKITLSVLLSIVLLLSVACEKTELKEHYYPNYKHLAILNEPGNWVPSFIPASAVEIKIRYKIDTGAELLTFFFRESKDLSLAGYCNKTTVIDLELPLPGFLGVTWWPDSLFRNRVKNKELAAYAFYRCERQAFLALRQSNSSYQAFYWRISLH